MSEANIVNFILGWLRENWQDSKCPICKSVNWFPEGRITELMESAKYSEGELSKYPIVHVVCHTCGFTMAFNAIIIGLMDEDGVVTV